MTGALLTALIVLVLVPTGVDADDGKRIAIGGGQTLVIEEDPFRLSVLDGTGDEVLATVPGTQGPPVRVPGIDGPQPVEPLGPLGGFPAIGFVVGAAEGLTFPPAVAFFTGNRMFGAETGTIVSVVGIESVERHGAETRIALTTDAPTVGAATLTVERLPAGGARLDLEAPEDLPGITSTMFTLASPEDEGLFGLGARKDAFDQRGLLRNVWVEQQNAGAGPFTPITGSDPTGTTGPTYTFPNGAQAAFYVQAVLLGSRGWGVWLGDTELSRVDLAASRGDAVRWGVATSGMQVRVSAPGDLEEASRSVTADLGRAPAPPRYAYEPWISVMNEGEGEAAPYGAEFTGGERVRRDVEEIVAKAEEHDLPIGVIGMEGWHEVPGVEDFADELRSRGYRLAAYWSPFINENSEVYDEAVANDYLVKDPTGRPFAFVTTRGYVNHVVDFTNPGAARWWGELYRWSFDLGFEAFMNDFGEFVTDGMRFHSGEPPETVHNAYPTLYHRAVRDAVVRYVAENPSFEPFFFVRAGYSGIGGSPGTVAATPGVFPGDETTDWDEGSGLPSIIPAMLNLALTGSYAFTTDVGGYLDLYTPQTDAELFTRWHQAATFTAISREHNSTFSGSARAWDFDEETLDIYRRYSRAKVALIGLVDSWARRAAADGTVGPVRPLVLDDPSPEAQAVKDQWLLGEDILVAPVVEEGARERDVYLPAGRSWERVVVGEDGALEPTGDVHGGGRTVTAPAPIDDIPIFVATRPTSERATGDGTERGEVLPSTGSRSAAVAILVLIVSGLMLRARRSRDAQLSTRSAS